MTKPINEAHKTGRHTDQISWLFMPDPAKPKTREEPKLYRFKCSIDTSHVMIAPNEEVAIKGFLDGWIDFNDVQVELLGEAEKGER